MATTFNRAEYPFKTLRFERGEHGAIKRIDRCQWGEESIERWFALNSRDVSAHHNNGEGYDSRCSLCWLNISHTEDLHQDRIGAGLQ